MSPVGWIAVQCVATALVGGVVYLLLRRQRRGFSSLEEQATLRTLASATSTLSSLRSGLSSRSAGHVLRQLAGPSGAEAVALFDTTALLAYHTDIAGAERHHSHAQQETAAVV